MKSAVVVGLFVLVCVAVSGFCEVQPKSYPLFKQCDPRCASMPPHFVPPSTVADESDR